MIKINDRPIFDADIISIGGLIRAKWRGWPDYKNGLVTRVMYDRITVLYLVNNGNAVAYYEIRADEVVNNEWELIYSSDFKEFISTESE